MDASYPELNLEEDPIDDWIMRYYEEVLAAQETILASSPEVRARIQDIGAAFISVCEVPPDRVAGVLLEPDTLDHLLTSIVWLDLKRRIAMISYLQLWAGERGPRVLDALIAADPPHRSRVIRETMQIMERSDTLRRMTQPLRIEALMTAIEQPETFNRTVTP